MLSLQNITKRAFLRRRANIINALKSYQRDQSLSYDDLHSKQLNRINVLLSHAANHVPFYRDLFLDLDMMNKNGVELKSLNQFAEIPFLTKTIIKDEGSRLYSDDHIKRGSFMNASGGSTGEPVRILQDQSQLIAEGATFLLPKSWKGVGTYDSEVFIWGSERDTFEGHKPMSTRIKDFLLNRISLNSFNMTGDDIEKYIQILNKHKPKMIRAYADSMYEIAIYARKNNIKVNPQNMIHTSAGSLHDFMREEIESVFGCPVYNHYGCREVGSIASECTEKDGLHVLVDHNIVEVVDEHSQLCKPGEEGEIVVTNLDNFAMPIIRYKIGDLGVFKEYNQCACGCTYPRLEKVTGRVTDVFRTSKGRVISPVFFAHLMGVIFKDANIGKFQFIQKSLYKVEVKIETNSVLSNSFTEELKSKVRLAMGESCNVEIKHVKSISKTPSGKFRYAVNETNLEPVK